MNSKIVNSIALVLCSILLCFITINVSGKWTGTVNYQGHKVAIEYDFKIDRNKVTGSVQNPAGKSEITDGSLNNNNIEFKAELQGDTAQHIGKVYSDSIVLNINYRGQTYPVTLKR